jgi:hypothetical protein
LRFFEPNQRGRRALDVISGEKARSGWRMCSPFR